MNRRIFEATVGLLIASAGVMLGAQAPASAPQSPQSTGSAAIAPGDPVRGKAVFLAHQCWACHGYSAETGTRLLLENGSFVGRLGNVSTFINYIRAPRPDQAPPARSLTSMPSYGVASMPNDQAADLYAYIRSLKPTSRALKEIPLLTQMASEGGKIRK